MADFVGNHVALVTGACGFLGSRIAARLASGGYRVLTMDRCDASDSTFEHVKLSLPDDMLADVLAQHRPEVIVHAAGPASVMQSVEDPLSDFRGSVVVLAELLDIVRRTVPDARVLLLSSAAVYGNPEELPVSESASLAPISPYGFHKVGCEMFAREYHDVYGVRTCALRIFSAYGAGLRRQLLWDVCEKASAGRVELSGTGDETRDFIHADDVAEGVSVLLESAAFEAEAYNCASGRETTIRQLSEELARCVDPEAAVTFSGVAREGDPMRWRADISAIRALGFEPKVDLSQGIAEYCEWYKKVMGVGA